MGSFAEFSEISGISLDSSTNIFLTIDILEKFFEIFLLIKSQVER